MYLLTNFTSKTQLYNVVNKLLNDKFGLCLSSVKFIDNDVRNISLDNIIKINQYN